MRWLNKYNKLVWHKDDRYRIKWDKKAPSKGAQTVKDFLKEHCSGSIWYEEYRLPGTLLKVDFLSPTKKIAIEFHGQQHETFNPFFHKTRSNFLASFKRDVKKEEILIKNSYTFVEIYNKDLKDLSKKWFLEKYNVLI